MPENAQVTPLYGREPDNAPGPFYVIKDRCLTCELPVATAPANISWSADPHDPKRTCSFHCRIERQPRTPEELGLLIEAAAGSCVEAVRYCGTDPDILARFRALGLAKLCDALPLDGA